MLAMADPVSDRAHDADLFTGNVQRTELICVRWAGCEASHYRMPRKSKEETLAELESNQAELRRNIEVSRELIERSDRLIHRYRSDHKEQGSRERN